MSLDPKSIQARRDRLMRAELNEDYGVKKAIARLKQWTHGRGYGYRRNLLTRSLRLTRSMSPEIADVIAECREMLRYPHAIEVYVRPERDFNASCYREDHGPTVLTLTSRLLEAFTPAELRFVIGHELGHAALDHYGIPMPITATIEDMGVPYVTRPTALKLYAWCRSAEVSADRIGLICARDPAAAASGFFKLASGMSSDRIMPDLTAFARQVESLASAPEAREKPRDDDDTLDCFSTHPYNPVRVRAVWAFSKSQPYLDAIGQPSGGALQLDEIENLIERDLLLMEPTYLQEKSNHADLLRRLLYTAGIAVAAAHGNGKIEISELEAIGKLLGADYAEAPSDVARVLADLDGRIKDCLEVPLVGRAQLIQHLTIVAHADGVIQDEELYVMEDIAEKLQVNPRIIHQTINGAMHPID